MALIKNFDPLFNFWEVNPQLKLVGVFKDLYDSDKSKKKEDSSLTMYFVANCYDNESNFHKLLPEEKHKLIGRDICKKEDFFEKNKKVLNPIIDLYMYFDDNNASRRALRLWEIKMDERSKFIQGAEYNFDTAEQLDKMMGNTKKLYDDYKRILEDLSKESSNTASKGDRELSLSDRGLI